MKSVNLPSYVKKTIQRLNQHGFQAYLVGGALRDILLRKTPDDWDLATNATPQEVQGLFSHHIDLGKKYGTIGVLYGKKLVQVTTFRTESSYVRNRFPTNVGFIHSIEEDLARRDFTINAIAWNSKEGFLDPFHGIIDLKRKKLRMVNDPNQRLEEDALRILRAARFIGKLNFSPDPKMTRAAALHVDKLNNISKERIQNELQKLLVSPNAGKGFNWLKKIGSLSSVFGRTMTVTSTEWRKFIFALENSPCHLEIRITILSSLLSTSTDERPINILNKLRFSNEILTHVRSLLRFNDVVPSKTPYELRKLAFEVGKSNIASLISLKTAYLTKRQLVKYKPTFFMLKRISKEPIYDLAVSGEDLMKWLGVKEGVQLGELLRELRHLVMKTPKMNTRARLKDYLIKSL